MGTTKDGVRIPTFFERYELSDAELGTDHGFDEPLDGLRCVECSARFARPTAWLDAHVSEHVKCPECSLDSRIPIKEESA